MGNMYLLAFRIINQPKNVDFYSYAIYNDECTPLHEGTRLIFFESRDDGQRAFARSKLAKKYSAPLPTKVHMICDLAETERLLRDASIDRQAVIINTCNLVDDILSFQGRIMPSRYRDSLYPLLDRLTFYRTYGKFLEKRRIRRSELLKALVWMKRALRRNAIVIPRRRGERS
jgi:hypothetical protein